MSEPSDVPHDRSFSDIQGRPFKLRAEMFNEIDVFSSKYFQLFIQTELDGRHVQTRALVRSTNDLRVHRSNHHDHIVRLNMPAITITVAVPVAVHAAPAGNSTPVCQSDADNSQPQCCHCGWRGAHAPTCPFR